MYFAKYLTVCTLCLSSSNNNNININLIKSASREPQLFVKDTKYPSLNKRLSCCQAFSLFAESCSHIVYSGSGVLLPLCRNSVYVSVQLSPCSAAPTIRDPVLPHA